MELHLRPEVYKTPALLSELQGLEAMRGIAPLSTGLQSVTFATRSHGLERLLGFKPRPIGWKPIVLSLTLQTLVVESGIEPPTLASSGQRSTDELLHMVLN